MIRYGAWGEVEDGATNNQCTGASSDTPAAPYVQDYNAWSTPDFVSALSATSSSDLVSTSMSKNKSIMVNLETHFLTCEDIEAASIQCAAVQNESKGRQKATGEQSVQRHTSSYVARFV